MIKNEFILDKKRITDFYYFIFLSSPGAGILVGISLWNIAQTFLFTEFSVINKLTTVIFWLIVYAAVCVLLVFYPARAFIKNSEKEQSPKKMIYCLEETLSKDAEAGEQAAYNYAEIRSVRTNKKYIFIHLGANRWCFLPKETFIQGDSAQAIQKIKQKNPMVNVRSVYFSVLLGAGIAGIIVLIMAGVQILGQVLGSMLIQQLV